MVCFCLFLLEEVPRYTLNSQLMQFLPIPKVASAMAHGFVDAMPMGCRGRMRTPVITGGMAEEHGDPAPDVGFYAAFAERRHHDVVT